MRSDQFAIPGEYGWSFEPKFNAPYKVLKHGIVEGACIYSDDDQTLVLAYRRQGFIFIYNKYYVSSFHTLAESTNIGLSDFIDIGHEIVKHPNPDYTLLQSVGIVRLPVSAAVCLMNEYRLDEDYTWSTAT